jgi:multidrug efflux pump subunit AcrA (membrane-fusion protein)
VESNQGALHTAELNLEYGTIRAPIAGRIGDSLVAGGRAGIAHGGAAAHHHRAARSHLGALQGDRIGVLAWTKRGQQLPAGQLTLILADGSEFPAKGRVTDTLNQVDPKTGTLELQASFPNLQHTLLPGQFGRIRVQVDERKDAIVIPQKAVQQVQSMQTVFVRDGGQQGAVTRHRHRQSRGRVLDCGAGVAGWRPHHRGRAVASAIRRRRAAEAISGGEGGELRHGAILYRSPRLRDGHRHRDGHPRRGGHSQSSGGRIPGSGAAGGADLYQLSGRQCAGP